MRVAVTGATGFVGRAISRELLLAGHELVVLTRDADRASRRFPYPARFHSWAPENGAVPLEALRGVDAVVNLAGEPIAEGRWSEAKKRRIRDSRIQGTSQLIDAITRLKGAGPKVVVSASAVGIYGDSGEPSLREDAPLGADFLAKVCADWESALFEASLSGVRRVSLRIGVVLGRGGGALEKMLPIFRAGLGGRLGSGNQWMSWIHIDDLSRLFLHALGDSRCEGPINAVAPNPVRNREFVSELARAIGTPAVMPAPASAIRLALGEMSQAVLGGQGVSAAKAEGLGFSFRYPGLRDAFFQLGLDDEEFFADQWVPARLDEVWPFFSDAKNLEAITPPWLGFKTTGTSAAEIGEGALIDYRLKIHGVPVTWRTRIEEWQAGSRFVDTQLRGPYSKWRHTHEFGEAQGGTLITDRVRYRLPMGAVGRLFASWKVKSDVAAIFAYRRKVISAMYAP